MSGTMRVQGVATLAAMFGVSTARIENWMAAGLPVVATGAAGAPEFHSGMCIHWVAVQYAYATSLHDVVEREAIPRSVDAMSAAHQQEIISSAVDGFGRRFAARAQANLEAFDLPVVVKVTSPVPRFALR